MFPAIYARIWQIGCPVFKFAKRILPYEKKHPNDSLYNRPGQGPAKAGYVVKEKEGRRNRYQIQTHLPLPEPTSQERAVGEILALLVGADATL
jgi:hypothetical protein